ncbi:MAG: CoA-binding protein [Candidatus Micrarchaeota archaeon]
MNEEGAIRKILMDYRRVAVVGISDESDKAGYFVPAYLKENGYEIIPVNPKSVEWKGKYSYESLEKVPIAIDVVLIFRKPEFVPDIVASAVKIHAKAVWMQEGIIHEEAAKLAEDYGLLVVMDRCMMKEHKKLYNRR